MNYKEMHSHPLIKNTQRKRCMHPKICYSIYLLLILLSNTFFDCTTNALDPIQMRKTCTELTQNSQCHCFTMMSEYRIECPSIEPFPKITVIIRPGIHARINCNQIVASEYHLLPQLNIGSHPVVQIRHCPLPGSHTPIFRIFERLGVTQVNTLFFETYELGTNLTSLHLKGLQNLTRLRFSSNGLTQMPSDLFTDMKNLTWLDLRSNNFELTSNQFVALENLHILELSHNNLEQLPLGIFHNQHKLIKLYLQSNQLRNLTKHDFDGLSALTDLDLSANGIKSFVADDVFEQLVNLTFINLSANNFTRLPTGLFSKNKKLAQFRLINNRVMLTALPGEFLANLPHLSEVHIEACDLIAIPANLFAKSSEITTLTLAHNGLVVLPAILLADQHRLNELDLSHNQLISLSNQLFRNTKQLVVLKLSHNQLTKISSELFAPLTQLELLYLDNNRLTIIDSGAFIYTNNIRSITMANNLLDFTQSHYKDQELVATPFQHLQELSSLNLSNNSITLIYNDWKQQLSVLQNLDLSYNNITTLSEEDLRFYSTKNMTLNLANNQIRTIDFKDINALKDISNTNRSLLVELNNNPMVCDCKLLSFIQYLGKHNSDQTTQSLNLQIEAKQLVCQEPANLQDKNIKEISPSSLLCPYGMGKPTHQRCPTGCDCWERSYDATLIINCAHRNLTQVPTLPLLVNDFKGMELNLTGNNLTELPMASTPGYADVTKIYATDNHIEQLEAYNLPPGLILLDVSRNSLEELDISVVNFFKGRATLSSLAIAGNPLTCSCQNEPLLRLALDHHDIIQNLKQIQCIDPHEPLKPKKFQDLSPLDLCAMGKRLMIALAATISVLGCLIGIALALFYKYKLEIKAWLFKHNLCLCLITEKELDKDKKYDAFISYSHKDEDFVLKYLLPHLEDGPKPFRVCIHERDFIVGEVISEQITQAMQDSRRTIIVLSPNFIESVWAQYEFKQAHRAALSEGRARIIAIMYKDIGDIEELNNDLKGYLKMNTYLKWGDRGFWEKLRYAMPHQCEEYTDNSPQTRFTVEDKLELILPAPGSPLLTTPPSNFTKNPLVEYLNGDTTIPLTNENMKATTNRLQTRDKSRAKHSDF